MAFGVSDLKITEVRCARCVESFPRPELPLSLDALRCPRCGNLRGNIPKFKVDTPTTSP